MTRIKCGSCGAGWEHGTLREPPNPPLECTECGWADTDTTDMSCSETIPFVSKGPFVSNLLTQVLMEIRKHVAWPGKPDMAQVEPAVLQLLRELDQLIPPIDFIDMYRVGSSMDGYFAGLTLATRQAHARVDAWEYYTQHERGDKCLGCDEGGLPSEHFEWEHYHEGPADIEVECVGQQTYGADGNGNFEID